MTDGIVRGGEQLQELPYQGRSPHPVKCAECSGYDPDDHEILCPMVVRLAAAELRARFAAGDDKQ